METNGKIKCPIQLEKPPTYRAAQLILFKTKCNTNPKESQLSESVTNIIKSDRKKLVIR